MILRSVHRTMIRCHGARRAVSKRFLEVDVRREPPLSAGNRHQIVVCAAAEAEDAFDGLVTAARDLDVLDY